ncbi:DNA-binding response regulator [Meridianimarinicoccus roseus]|jgi:DNA-binding response OmpR family regulator|uniref:DNA-binding response regulator n=1 Tax=Meridianimarinicoccus roseus TaxID=2072018 RepID=A0A2V2LF87_9RHOB|nr:response regulator transcription factor [Meridianimarinicoccus roseus]PWR04280.1 DNA-binding response regulator [Meridianimarinicoccus roseus]
MTPRLLIVDDDPGITSALARGLALHGYSAVTENRADRALALLRSEAFDGAIVDVMLGDDSGIDMVRAARAAGLVIPVLMLSALSEVAHRTAGLEAGADDYVVKPFSFDELVARLRVQEQRARAHRPAPARLCAVARRLEGRDKSVSLTEREFDLLALLAECPGTPRPRGEIFDALWAADGSSTENVVDVYIGYLRKKLAGCDAGFQIRTLRNRGFCLDGLPPVRI